MRIISFFNRTHNFLIVYNFYLTMSIPLKSKTEYVRKKRDETILHTLTLARILVINFNFIITFQCSDRKSKVGLHKIEIYNIYMLKDDKYVSIYTTKGKLVEERRAFSFDLLIQLLEAHQYEFTISNNSNVKNYEHNGIKYVKRHPVGFTARKNYYELALLKQTAGQPLYNEIFDRLQSNRYLKYVVYYKTSDEQKLKDSPKVNISATVDTTIIRDHWDFEEMLEDIL